MADKTVVVRIVLRANQLSSGLKGASNDVSRFATTVERGTDKAASSALALGAASATAGKVLLVGIGGALAVSAKAAIDFESSLAGVAKTTDLAGSAFAKAGSPLAAFGQALRSLSLRIPINVNELAAIAEAGGQLGIQVPNLIEFTEVMAAMGVSTNISATEAAEGFARFANIMGTSQDQFGRLGSIVVDLGNKFATTEAEILHFGTRLAPIGKTVGMTEEEVFALSSALTSLGVPAERGGTALQRIFMDMQAAVISGDESLTAFAKAARMTEEEFSDLFQDSPAEAFSTLVRELDRTNQSGGSALATLRELGIIEQRSIQVILAAANGWETVADSIEVANEAGAEGNALFVEAARRYGTSASQIQILSNSFNDLRIEIGNALLGSGGLSSGIDFLREFFRVIKDNLPVLGNLASVLATVAAIRLGATAFRGLKEGIDQLRALRAGTEAVTRGMAAMRLGMLGLNTAVFAAIAVAGILITKWAAAAAKAAELRRMARELSEEFESGADPIETFISTFRDQEILDPRFEEQLHEVGLSYEDLVRGVQTADSALQGVANASTVDFYKELAAVTGETEEALRDAFGGRNIGEINNNIRDFQEGIKGAAEIVDAFFDMKADEVRNGLIEAGLGAKFTTEQLDGMADAAVRAADVSTSVEDIVASFTEGTPGRRQPGGRIVEGLETSNRAIKQTWEDMLMTSEEGEGRIEDFFDSLGSTTEEFVGTLEDSFIEVKDAIMGSFPAWDEYEQKSIDSLNKVIEAQDLYLEDLRDGFNLQEELQGEVSGNVLNFIENLDPATKGALARYRETNREGFNAWVADIDENLTEAGGLINDFWGLELPGALEVGFNQIMATALHNARGLELPGEQTAQAFIDGLMSQMENLPAEHQDDFMAFIAAAFSDKEFLASIGLSAGDPIVQGLLSALSGLSEKAIPLVRDEFGRLQRDMRARWEAASPSKVTMRLGEDITQGLFVGMEDETQRQLASSRLSVQNQIFNPNPTMNVQVKPQGGSRDIHIYYPEHKSDDVVDGVRKASILAGLQREAEVAIGPG